MKKSIYLSILSVLIAFFFACSSSTEEKSMNETGSAGPAPAIQNSAEESDTVYTTVDKMPVFAGGDKELLKYISERVVYPEAAKKAGTEGRSIVRFCVEADGRITKVSVVKGSSPELDAEAIRVINDLPAFETPGYKDGQPVPVWYMVPISFKLR